MERSMGGYKLRLAHGWRTECIHLFAGRFAETTVLTLEWYIGIKPFSSLEETLDRDPSVQVLVLQNRATPPPRLIVPLILFLLCLLLLPPQ